MPDPAPATSAIRPAPSGRGWCCPHCGGFVRPDATACKHCAYQLLPAVTQRPEVIAIRWQLLGRWLLASVVGVLIGTLAYQLIPFDLRFPRVDEDIWLEEPWRLAVLNAVSFSPVSVAQWLALRGRAPRAGWAMLATVGSAVALYPGSIWALWSARYWDLAADVWFFGLGGSAIFWAAQLASLVFVNIVYVTAAHGEGDTPAA